jgi:hypothetical protein
LAVAIAEATLSVTGALLGPDLLVRRALIEAPTLVAAAPVVSEAVALVSTESAALTAALAAGEVASALVATGAASRPQIKRRSCGTKLQRWFFWVKRLVFNAFLID